MPKKYLLFSALVVLVVVAVGTVVSLRRSPSGSVAGAAAEVPASPTSAVKIIPFSIEGGMYYFTPNEIRVKQGNRVRITFNNVEGLHDLVIDEFNARTKIIKAGESDTVEFLADKKGIFEYYCSVGNHRQQGMVGNLVIE
jgi:plastocyanin